MSRALTARRSRLAAQSLLAALLAPAPLVAQQSAFHIANYDISLDLPDAGKTIAGHVELTAVRKQPADTLMLDLLDLRVSRVTVAGKDAPFTQDAEYVRIPVRASRGTSRVDTTIVGVDYSGEVKDGLIIGTDSAGRWMAFGDNWPNRARHWIPSIDHPHDKSTVSWTIHAPMNRVVVGNGAAISRVCISCGGQRRGAPPVQMETKWRESHPIPVYLFTIAAAPLELFNLPDAACGFARDTKCASQMVYTAPEQHPAMPANFRYAPDIMDFFTHLIAPFPYEKLAHLQSSTRFGGMENASAIFYADGGFRRGGTPVGTIAHETAHQWFGDAVTEREWSNLWLSEGFATYFEELWTRHAFGDSAFHREMAQTRAQILRDPTVAARPVIDSEQTDLMKLLDANSYQKGGWTLHMLRVLVGDSAFFRGIREYYKSHVDGNALTDDLMAAVEQQSGTKLGWFFDQWLRRPGFASLTTNWHYDAAARRVVLDVQQGARYSPYRVQLAIDVTDAAGAVHRVRVELPAKPSVQLTIPLELAAAPRAIVFDPDVELLAEFHER